MQCLKIRINACCLWWSSWYSEACHCTNPALQRTTRTPSHDAANVAMQILSLLSHHRGLCANSESHHMKDKCATMWRTFSSLSTTPKVLEDHYTVSMNPTNPTLHWEEQTRRYLYSHILSLHNYTLCQINTNSKGESGWVNQLSVL